ncbi:MAG TPA: hypothetical protein PLB46_15785 [Chitinophagales bacterium]|nr:hypothetical protein [Chitinophagales bacterium]
MKYIKLSEIFFVAIFFLNCEKKSNNVVSNKQGQCWDYIVMNSKKINPVHGICLKDDGSAFYYTNDFEDSIRYINDRVNDADPGGLTNVFFTWKILPKNETIILDAFKGRLIHFSADSIVYLNGENNRNVLVPSNQSFKENWDVLNRP